MNSSHNELQVSLYIAEYEKLKDEQIARIGFRDNLVYATLVAIGGILSFGLSNQAFQQSLLILPLANVVLGWLYLNNDLKISSLAHYIRSVLRARIEETCAPNLLFSFEWELAYKREQRRLERKVLQLLVNLALFVGSGLIALVSFVNANPLSQLTRLIVGLEFFALFVLAVEIIIYADFRPPRSRWP